MIKETRGRYILTLVAMRTRIIKRGRYEREQWTYEFKSDDGALFEYDGKRYMLFVNKRYEIIATKAGTSYGRTVLKRLNIQPLPIQTELFER